MHQQFVLKVDLHSMLRVCVCVRLVESYYEIIFPCWLLGAIRAGLRAGSGGVIVNSCVEIGWCKCIMAFQ